MALETLKELKDINGYEISRVDEGIERADHFIHIVDSSNAIAFKIQNGPVKEVGVNGCQVDELITTARLMIEGLNKNFPCHENSIVITKLQEAEMWLNQRKIDREKRNVEGKSLK